MAWFWRYVGDTVGADKVAANNCSLFAICVGDDIDAARCYISLVAWFCLMVVRSALSLGTHFEAFVYYFVVMMSLLPDGDVVLLL